MPRAVRALAAPWPDADTRDVAAVARRVRLNMPHWADYFVNREARAYLRQYHPQVPSPAPLQNIARDLKAHEALLDRSELSGNLVFGLHRRSIHAEYGP